MDPITTTIAKPVVNGFANEGVLGLCILVLLAVIIVLARHIVIKDRELTAVRDARLEDSKKYAAAMLELQKEVIHAVNEVREEPIPATVRGRRGG